MASRSTHNRPWGNLLEPNKENAALWDKMAAICQTPCAIYVVDTANNQTIESKHYPNHLMALVDKLSEYSAISGSHMIMMGEILQRWLKNEDPNLAVPFVKVEVSMGFASVRLIVQDFHAMTGLPALAVAAPVVAAPPAVAATPAPVTAPAPTLLSPIRLRSPIRLGSPTLLGSPTRLGSTGPECFQVYWQRMVNLTSDQPLIAHTIDSDTERVVRTAEYFSATDLLEDVMFGYTKTHPDLSDKLDQALDQWLYRGEPDVQAALDALHDVTVNDDWACYIPDRIVVESLVDSIED